MEVGDCHAPAEKMPEDCTSMMSEQYKRAPQRKSNWTELFIDTVSIKKNSIVTVLLLLLLLAKKKLK